MTMIRIECEHSIFFLLLGIDTDRDYRMIRNNFLDNNNNDERRCRDLFFIRL